MVFLASFLVLFPSAIARTSLAQTRTVGVNPGQWFKYGDVSFNWSSNDTGASFPDSMREMNDTLWMQGDVVSVVQTNVTLQMIAHYRNGTEEVSGGWVDVDTGEGDNATIMLISSDLGVNDSIYTSGYSSTWRINETVPRMYTFEYRDTNHLNMSSGYSYMGNSINYSYNLYWDKTTGILMEESVVFTNQTGVYHSEWSLLVKMTETNIWVIPEFPSVLMLPLFMATTLLTAIFLKRRYRKQANLSFS